MTLISLFLTTASDPGYISVDFQHPKEQNGSAPLNKLRVYNMGHFINNKLYDFSKQLR